MELRHSTSPEEWKARRKWLLVQVVGISMLVGALIEPYLLSTVIIVGGALRWLWLFYRHRVARKGADYEPDGPTWEDYEPQISD